MTPIHRVGEHDGRTLYVGSSADLDEWPAELSVPFVALSALDARARTDGQLETLARELLDRRCVYACAWGPDAGRVESAFDHVAVAAEDAGRPYVDDVVMTTSHEDESLDEALWFGLFAAMTQDGAPPAVVAIADVEWLAEVERRLADPDQLMADVLGRDEGAS